MTDLPPLTRPARRALIGFRIHSLEDLAQFSEGRVAAMHGIGPNVLETLRAALEENGLSFAPEEDDESDFIWGP